MVGSVFHTRGEWVIANILPRRTCGNTQYYSSSTAALSEQGRQYRDNKWKPERNGLALTTGTAEMETKTHVRNKAACVAERSMVM